MEEKIVKILIKESLKSYKIGEVPVGCVIIKNNKIIATGHNTKEKNKCAIHHAEINAIIKACKKNRDWRLENCKLYVTLEPCPMCCGAIINSRLKEIIYGASDKKSGSCGSVINLFDLPYNHKPSIKNGILRKECSEILSSFFKLLRKNKSKKKDVL